MDHIDGDHLNSVLSKLRLLCPNCHGQVPTFRGRNGKYKGIPHLRDIEAGIVRCGSVKAYAHERNVTSSRVEAWLRSDRLRARDKYVVGKLAIGAQARPGGETWYTHGT